MRGTKEINFTRVHYQYHFFVTQSCYSNNTCQWKTLTATWKGHYQMLFKIYSFPFLQPHLNHYYHWSTSARNYFNWEKKFSVPPPLIYFNILIDKIHFKPIQELGGTLASVLCSSSTSSTFSIKTTSRSKYMKRYKGSLLSNILLHALKGFFKRNLKAIHIQCSKQSGMKKCPRYLIQTD